MAPIRVALIGLSARATTSWAKGAHLPYLLSPRGRARFQIVALLNSSVEAARAAIAEYGLSPSAVRAYGSPADLAADADVDLVVCATRVDKHFDTVRPSVAAGKDVLVEWPLAENAARAGELAALAKERGGRTAVAVQGRLAPVFVRIRQVLEGGEVGRVLGSQVRAVSQKEGGDVFPEGLRYFTERRYGGNSYTIGFGHLWDSIQSVLGDAEDLHALLQIQRPEIKIREQGGTKIIETVTTNVPDVTLVTARLPESSIVKKGATLIAEYRRNPAFKDPKEPALVWTISGEKGNLRLVSPASIALNGGAYGLPDPITVELHDIATGEVKSVEWQWEGWQEDVPHPGRSIASLYEAFADGAESKYATFDVALKRHQQLDSLLDKFLE